MGHVWFVGFIATCFGIGLGGGIASIIHRFKRSIGTVYAVCTGLLLGLVSIEIIPEAIELGNWFVFAGGFGVGVLLFEWMHRLFPNHSRKDHGRNTGIFLAAIISLHNFPMGVVLGTSEQTEVGFALLQAMLLHNIPEGMVLFTPFCIAGIRFFVLCILSVLIALPVAAGAFLGQLIGAQHHVFWAFLISLSVGTIYMVTMKEILPESIRRSSNTYSVFVASIAFGLMAVYLLCLE
ncbi:ZIP family metal transporter [Sporosarcina sp. Te-1]|uniref:ZIP family metal transporter n=1 Tax=Sporosarcina sp. Te-1 TaxID=2818390 RepID=UPI001A9D20C3|nr:ZIP family metal transporter [Sporosarcina sp. Te-1]QTD40130.1 ZIP family metal transporter [Sporosarcina sp. Te-1]